MATLLPHQLALLELHNLRHDDDLLNMDFGNIEKRIWQFMDGGPVEFLTAAAEKATHATCSTEAWELIQKDNGERRFMPFGDEAESAQFWISSITMTAIPKDALPEPDPGYVVKMRRKIEREMVASWGTTTGRRK